MVVFPRPKCVVELGLAVVVRADQDPLYFFDGQEELLAEPSVWQLGSTV